MTGVGLKRWWSAAWMPGMFLVCLATQAQPTSTSEFNIKRQSLGTALLDYSYQANIQVVMPGSLAEGRMANPVSGELTRAEALDRLLAGSGLEYAFSGQGTVTIRQKPRSEVQHATRRRRFEDWGLEQMLVTAPQGRESVRDTTVSMSALNGEDLESRGVTTADELQRYVPGLTVESPQIGNTAFSIRGAGAGVGNDDLSIQSGVGVFIDDIYIPRSGPANMALYELDRVEVLRGPQSVRYGRNATGGALVYVTRKPTPDFEARYLSDYGTQGRFNNILTINGELADSVYGQVAIASFNRSPIMKNARPDLPDGNDTDSQSGRVSLRGEPSDAVEWVLSVDGEQNHQQAVLYSIGPSGPFQFNEQTPEVPASEPTYTASVDSAGPQRLDTAGLMARVNIKSEQLWSSYIVGRRSHDLYGVYDLDQTLSPLVTKRFDETSDLTSLEARWGTPPPPPSVEAGHLAWQAGLEVFQEDAEAIKIYDAPGLDAGVNRWKQSLWEDSYSAFVQWGYALTRRWRLIAGGRYTTDFRRFRLSGLTTAPGEENPYIRESFYSEHDRDWRRVTPRLGVHFQHTENTALYASMATGYRPGGYFGTAGSARQADRPFDHERVVSTEVGIRSNLAENRMKFNAAVYSNQFDDMQVTGTGRAGKGIVDNAEAAEIRGVEMEIQARPVPALNLRAGLSLVDARFEEFALEQEGETVDKDGDRIPRIPRATFNLSAVYLFPDLSKGTWSVRADAIYSDEAEDINNDLAWPNYRIYNLWLDYLMHNGQWEFSVWVRNLRDEVYFQATSPGITADQSAFARKLESPRVVGLSWKYFW